MLYIGQLAWAAGFFDGEGSTIARTDSRRPGYLQLCVSASQRGFGEVPAVLLRFQRAVLGLGRVTGPEADGTYQWRSRGFTDAQATIALLWPFLGDVKRRQAVEAMRAVRAQYGSHRYARRPRAACTVQDARQNPAERPRTLDEQGLERAWAAGFLDGEGCFGLIRRYARKQGPAWYAVRASATQHGELGRPAGVLLRLERALGGIGRIERHGEPDDFKWLVEGPAAIECVLELTEPWLGSVKLAQARSALDAFAAQVRLRGDSERCIRGHTYDRVRVTADRLHRFCNACGRIRERNRRAAQGIKPRQFRDPARRYAS